MAPSRWTARPLISRYTWSQAFAACLALAATVSHQEAAAQTQSALSSRLADLAVIDRATGVRLPVYQHDGQFFVAGRPGARYAIEIRNRRPRRLLAVVSVDGINVISGETASWEQTGYVFGPREVHAIDGWRKSDDEIAAFAFTALGNDYASRTGRPENVGVIGLALFRERPGSGAVRPPPIQRPLPSPQGPESHWDGSGSDVPYSGSAPQAKHGSSQSSIDAQSEAASRNAPVPSPVPRLGTAHGERQWSPITHTRFERATAAPAEVLLIRYDSWENLVAAGVVPTYSGQYGAPQAFPLAPSAGYVPDPPGWSVPLR